MSFSKTSSPNISFKRTGIHGWLVVWEGWAKLQLSVSQYLLSQNQE